MEVTLPPPKGGSHRLEMATSRFPTYLLNLSNCSPFPKQIKDCLQELNFLYNTYY